MMKKPRQTFSPKALNNRSVKSQIPDEVETSLHVGNIHEINCW